MFDYVISALAKVLKKYKNVRLVIPGPSTNHTKNLIRLAKRLDIEHKVYFIGLVTETQLKLLYKSCGIYWYPSPEEDFGLGPLEAGGWAVPTVAWNNAGPTITVKDGVSGFLAEPYDVNDYADKILKLLENPNLRIKMGKAAWERTRRIFSWENHIRTVENALLSSLKG